MDTRPTPEQAELRRTARQLARELGPRTVADLDDHERRARLSHAVSEAGWLELRNDAGGGVPLASGVEAAIIAEALGECVADVPFMGPLLAAELTRRAGGDALGGAVVAFAPDLVRAAVVTGPETRAPVIAVDSPAQGPVRACVLAPEGDGHGLALVETQAGHGGSDLTRSVCKIESGAPLRPMTGIARTLTSEDLDAWVALGLALTSADLVGIMRGVLDVSVRYARERKQYGVAIGSFQAVQHLLAEAHCLMEGAVSTVQYAAWAVDELPAAEARAAGRVAKAYCARASRAVCETAIQVHGGMGNTWDCVAHVYLRRALLSAQWLGDDGRQLRELERTRLGVPDGLS